MSHRCLSAALGVLLTACLAPAAGAVGEIGLGHGIKPTVAIASDGTAHLAWLVPGDESRRTIVYCRVLYRHDRCDRTVTFPVPGALSVQILIEPGGGLAMFVGQMVSNTENAILIRSQPGVSLATADPPAWSTSVHSVPVPAPAGPFGDVPILVNYIQAVATADDRYLYAVSDYGALVWYDTSVGLWSDEKAADGVGIPGAIGIAQVPHGDIVMATDFKASRKPSSVVNVADASGFPLYPPMVAYSIRGQIHRLASAPGRAIALVTKSCGGYNSPQIALVRAAGPHSLFWAPLGDSRLGAMGELARYVDCPAEAWPNDAAVGVAPDGSAGLLFVSRVDGCEHYPYEIDGFCLVYKQARAGEGFGPAAQLAADFGSIPSQSTLPFNDLRLAQGIRGHAVAAWFDSKRVEVVDAPDNDPSSGTIRLAWPPHPGVVVIDGYPFALRIRRYAVCMPLGKITAEVVRQPDDPFVDAHLTAGPDFTPRSEPLNFSLGRPRNPGRKTVFAATFEPTARLRSVRRSSSTDAYPVTFPVTATITILHHKRLITGKLTQLVTVNC